MKKTDWVARCAARIVAVSGQAPQLAKHEAEALAAEQAEVNGASGVAWQAPEDAADERLLEDVDHG